MRNFAFLFYLSSQDSVLGGILGAASSTSGRRLRYVKNPGTIAEELPFAGAGARKQFEDEEETGFWMRMIQNIDGSIPSSTPVPPSPVPTVAPSASPSSLPSSSPSVTTSSIPSSTPVPPPSVPTAAPSTSPASLPSCERNLLINGDFEFGNTTGWDNPGAVVVQSPEPGWDVSTFLFSPGAFITYGGRGSTNKVLSQTIDLSSFAAEIDQGGLEYEMSAWLVSLQPAGTTFRYDEVFLSVSFSDETGTTLLRTPELTDPTIPGEGLGPNGNIWDLVSETGIIPSSTRSATVFLRYFRPIGIETAGFADNVVFCIS